jgi:putative endonuclease
MFYVYAIRSLLRSYLYVGMTSNVQRRLEQHNRRHNRTTRAYAPFRLIHVESFETRPSARAREIFLKSGAGKEFLRSL